MRAYQVEIEKTDGTCEIVWPSHDEPMRLTSEASAEQRYAAYRALVVGGASNVEGRPIRPTTRRPGVEALILREVDVENIGGPAADEKVKRTVRREPMFRLRPDLAA